MAQEMTGAGPAGERQREDRQESPWVHLVQRVREGESEALEELYAEMERWTRPYLVRALGPGSSDDRIHDAYLAVVEKIQEGGLRDPSALIPFVRGVVRNMTASRIARKARRSETGIEGAQSSVAESPGPEEQLELHGRRREAGEALEALPALDREILIRFYILEHDWRRICGDLGITQTQFRLRKSRALAKVRQMRVDRE